MILSHTKSLMEDKKEELEDCILVLSDVLDVMYTKDYVSFILGWYFKDRDKLREGQWEGGIDRVLELEKSLV
jgi:hypothetical protein